MFIILIEWKLNRTVCFYDSSASLWNKGLMKLNSFCCIISHSLKKYSWESSFKWWTSSTHARNKTIHINRFEQNTSNKSICSKDSSMIFVRNSSKKKWIGKRKDIKFCYTYKKEICKEPFPNQNKSNLNSFKSLLNNWISMIP